MNPELPPIGAQFERTALSKRGKVLIRIVFEVTAIDPEIDDCERWVCLTVVESFGSMWRPGESMTVEPAWFIYRKDYKRIK